MRYHGMFALLACSAVMGGCADPSETPPTTTGTPAEAKNELTFHTGEFEAPAGDSFECFYTDTITDKELSAVSATATQGSGGHHVTIYYTDTPRKAQHHPCTDAEMASWHQIAGAGGVVGESTGAEGLVQLPPGLAVKIASGKQIVVQSHYINTTGAPEKVNDSITLNLVEPKEVKAYANYYVMNNDEFEVAPQAKLTSQRTCTLSTDLDTVVVLGHMHQAGKHFKLERAADGKSFETLYDHDWAEEYVSHPPVLNYTMDKPLHFTKGTKLRTTCTWNNSSTDPMIFPNEMCIAFMYYFPDAGERYCDLDPEPPAP